MGISLLRKIVCCFIIGSCTIIKENEGAMFWTTYDANCGVSDVRSNNRRNAGRCDVTSPIVIPRLCLKNCIKTLVTRKGDVMKRRCTAEVSSEPLRESFVGMSKRECLDSEVAELLLRALEHDTEGKFRGPGTPVQVFHKTLQKFKEPLLKEVAGGVLIDGRIKASPQISESDVPEQEKMFRISESCRYRNGLSPRIRSLRQNGEQDRNKDESYKDILSLLISNFANRSSNRKVDSRFLHNYENRNRPLNMSTRTNALQLKEIIYNRLLRDILSNLTTNCANNKSHRNLDATFLQDNQRGNANLKYNDAENVENLQERMKKYSDIKNLVDLFSIIDGDRFMKHLNDSTKNDCANGDLQENKGKDELNIGRSTLQKTSLGNDKLFSSDSIDIAEKGVNNVHETMDLNRLRNDEGSRTESSILKNIGLNGRDSDEHKKIDNRIDLRDVLKVLLASLAERKLKERCDQSDSKNFLTNILDNSCPSLNNVVRDTNNAISSTNSSQNIPTVSPKQGGLKIRITNGPVAMLFETEANREKNGPKSKCDGNAFAHAVIKICNDANNHEMVTPKKSPFNSDWYINKNLPLMPEINPLHGSNEFEMLKGKEEAVGKQYNLGGIGVSSSTDCTTWASTLQISSLLLTDKSKLDKMELLELAGLHNFSLASPTYNKQDVNIVIYKPPLGHTEKEKDFFKPTPKFNVISNKTGSNLTLKETGMKRRKIDKPPDNYKPNRTNITITPSDNNAYMMFYNLLNYLSDKEETQNKLKSDIQNENLITSNLAHHNTQVMYNSNSDTAINNVPKIENFKDSFETREELASLPQDERKTPKLTSTKNKQDILSALKNYWSNLLHRDVQATKQNRCLTRTLPNSGNLY